MKILIVGGGPAGCYLGQLLQKYGYSPLILEEHSEVGQPVQCAGLVGKDVFKKSILPLPSSSIKNVINGAIFHCGDISFPLHRPEVAYVIDRAVFDREISRGLELRLSTRLLGLEKDGNSCAYRAVTNKGIFPAELVIGADGPRSRVREVMGLKEKIRYYRGFQLRLQTSWEPTDMVEVYVRRPFFFWIIPEGDKIIRVGVVSSNPYRDLLDFLRERNIQGEILEKNNGILPVGTCQLVGDRIALVGDAAGQVKPLTGGGIYYGLKAAEILADCIHQDRLGDYAAKWQKHFGKEIAFALRLRKIYETLSDDDLVKIFLYFKENALKIEKAANFEIHSFIIRELIKNLKVTKIGFSALLGILKTLIFPNGRHNEYPGG